MTDDALSLSAHSSGLSIPFSSYQAVTATPHFSEILVLLIFLSFSSHALQGSTELVLVSGTSGQTSLLFIKPPQQVDWNKGIKYDTTIKLEQSLYSAAASGIIVMYDPNCSHVTVVSYTKPGMASHLMDVVVSTSHVSDSYTPPASSHAWESVPLHSLKRGALALKAVSMVQKCSKESIAKLRDHCTMNKVILGIICFILVIYDSVQKLSLSL